MSDAFERLSNLQMQVGYKPGKINLVALLGAFGEAGEVLEEWLNQFDAYQINSNWFLKSMNEAVQKAKEIDGIKKGIRDEKINIGMLDATGKLDEDALDKEIADQLYYLNALAVNRGKNLEYYADLSYEKVSSRIRKNL